MKTPKNSFNSVTFLQGQVHPDEWTARLELAACYRVFAMLGWTEMIYNHITVRFPDKELPALRDKVQRFRDEVVKPLGAVIEN